MNRNRYSFEEMKLPAYTSLGGVSDCWSLVPEELVCEIRCWIENGVLSDQSPLVPLLTGQNSDLNLKIFFMIYAPRNCWGSEEAVNLWKGLHWPPVRREELATPPPG